MSEFNVPDDWGMYYRKCSDCGSRWHASEGGCFCETDREERIFDEVLLKLQKIKIVDIESFKQEFSDRDELGDFAPEGTKMICLFSKNDEEISLTRENWGRLVACLVGYVDNAREIDSRLGEDRCLV